MLVWRACIIMPLKKSKTIILLIIIFLWSILKDIETLVRYSTTTDYQLLGTIGLAFLVPIFAGVLLALHFVALWYLFKPKPRGLRFGFVSVGIDAVVSLIVWGISVADMESARIAYTTSRAARGLSLREEHMEFLFSPIGLAVTLSIIIGTAFIVGYLLWRNRRYFSGMPNNS